MSHSYLCQFGNTPDLSLYELRRMTGSDIQITRISDQIAQLSLESDEQAASLLQRSGGIVKLMSLITSFEDQTSDELQTILADHLLEQSELDKITFSVAEIGRDHLTPIDPGAVKRALRQAGRKVRYQPAPRSGLSAAVLTHHDVIELVVVQTGPKSGLIARTLSTQNIDHWTHKDREKPYADRKKGMLPPKLARMLVNIATGSQSQQDLAGKVLLDPFCGSGTILIEALELGLTVAGSDTDERSVQGTKENLAWFSEESAEYNVTKADASKITPAQRVDFLVTEPFLGKPKPKPEQIENIFTGLHRMYLGAFKHWRSILKPGAHIVIIFPRARGSELGKKHDVTLESLIDKLQALGYTMQSEPIGYFRPQAVIARDIYHFEFSGNT